MSNISLSLSPSKDLDGNITTTSEEYQAALDTFSRKEPLREACNSLNIYYPKTAGLLRLRSVLFNYWYPNVGSDTVLKVATSRADSFSAAALASCITSGSDETILAELGIEKDDADELLGYDEDEEEDDEPCEDNDEEDEDLGEEDDEDSDSDLEFEEFKRRVRVEETQRAEMTRRRGGIKTQEAVVRDWSQFVEQALEKGEIKDDIIDEHHLLLYLRFTSERPKRTRRGKEIPGTFVGAAQIKKLYFGALRIRKQQEAMDPSIKTSRVFNTVHVWDVVRSRLNESLHRVRSGLVPGEDAPDIIANTFLAGVTPEQMEKIGIGFLKHRELRSVINGHLAWTAQNASGNRGDDFRALKLAELQPYVFLHPNKQTAVECVLGCQGEEKAGATRGLQTKSNPVYSVFIAHRDAFMCPLGGLAFYSHFQHDVVNLTDLAEIDWALNSTWRQIRVLHGKTSPKSPYHEQSLYNLYVKAFKLADVASRMKQHLPRHLLAYSQEKMGVDSTQTARMGWSRGSAYFDNYAPAIPKEAVLGAHGYKTHETYDPVWRHVQVPEHFLSLVCPMAEGIHANIVGKDNLSGAANYWSMIISLRPYVFQCGAAIFQKCPESGLFRLPALANPDVRNWMKHDFPSQLSALEASAGSQIDFERIQNQQLRLALEDMRSLLQTTTNELTALRQILQRRTQCLSPTKGYSAPLHRRRRETAGPSHSVSALPLPALVLRESTPSPSPRGSSLPADTPPLLPDSSVPDWDNVINTLDDTGVYEGSDAGLRAFVNESPKAPDKTPRQKTQVDLVLPPTMAFSAPGEPQMFWPPVLGQRSVTWDQVFQLIKRPDMLWECWKPSKTLDKYTLHDQWACYNTGEAVFNEEGVQRCVKPPLRQVEMYFHSKWRTDKNARKQWERFREIPEYIDSESLSRRISPQAVMEELEEVQRGSVKLKGLSALTKHVKELRQQRALLRSAVTSTQREEEDPSLKGASSQITDQRPSIEGEGVADNPFIDTTSPLTTHTNVTEEQRTGATSVNEFDKGRKRKAPVDSRRRSKKAKT